MKKISLVFIFLQMLTGPVLAQTPSDDAASVLSSMPTSLESSTTTESVIKDETNLNNKLYENSKISTENAAKLKAKETPQEIRYFNNGQNTTENNLTDQEKQLSENFVHQGLTNQIITEKCTGDMASICAGNDGKSKFLGMDSKMVRMAAQMYALFGTLSGGLKLSKKPEKAAATKAPESTSKTTTAASDNTSTSPATDSKAAESGADKSKKEEASDYCKYIPTLTEGVATVQQMAASKEIDSYVQDSDNTAQKDSLLAAAKSHDSRAKMAQIQAAGWFGGAACYVAGAATGKFATDRNLIIKTAAATFLGGFYQNEVKANKDYASKTRAIANTLPGKGDCNPITDKLCYCSQASTENDPTYCKTTLHKKQIAKDSYRVACTDKNLKTDPTCNCEKTNSCFDSTLDFYSDGNINMGVGSANSPYSGIRSLARGELVGGTLNDSAFAKAQAIAKKGLRDLAPKVELGALSKNQKADAALLESQGIPSSVSNALAGSRVNDSDVSAAMARMGGSSGATYAAISPAKTGNIIEFGSGGNGLGIRGKKASENNSNEFLDKLKGTNGKNKANNSNVIEFAQKAQAQAQKGNQIRKDDTPIFEIISMRYQTSGRRLLEIND